MWRVLEHIRAVGWCPADWHHAMAFASKKPNNKVGPEGVRVMRCFDGVALSWFAALRQHGAEYRPYSWQHGGIEGRDRVDPIL
eukprot:3021518-Lingulodinium_polyedra.AAC.1